MENGSRGRRCIRVTLRVVKEMTRREGEEVEVTVVHVVIRGRSAVKGGPINHERGRKYTGDPSS